MLLPRVFKWVGNTCPTPEATSLKCKLPFLVAVTLQKSVCYEKKLISETYMHMASLGILPIYYII